MTIDDEIALIDWDTVVLAPRERDLWMIEPRDPADRADAWRSLLGYRGP